MVDIDQVSGLENIIRKVETIRNQGNNSYPHSELTNYLGILNLDHIVSITDANGNESFTIDIENEESGINFEKLHLVKYMNGYIASVQRFEPTQTWYDAEENVSTFSGQIHNMSLNRDTLWSATLQNGVVITQTNGSGAENSVPCYISIYWVDGEGQQYNDDPTDGDNYKSAEITMLVDIVCDDSGNNSGWNSYSGGTDDNGSGSTSGTFVGTGAGGGSANNPQDGADTSCNNCDTGTSIDLNNERIKQMLLAYSQNETIKTKMVEYRGKLSTDRKEAGARFKLVGTNTFSIREATARNGVSVSYDPAYLPNEIVSLHIHVNEADVEKEDGTIIPDVTPTPMYSHGDVLEFFEHVDEVSSLQKDYVASILITRKGTFALTVGDKSQMEAANNELFNDDEYDRYLYEFWKLVLKDSADISDADFVKRVVDFINTHTVNYQPMGISVYQAIIGSDGITITGWRKL